MQCASALQVTIALNLRSQLGNPQTGVAVARDCADHIIANPEVAGVQAAQPDEQATNAESDRI
jgi:hypothetical protein